MGIKHLILHSLFLLPSKDFNAYFSFNVKKFTITSGVAQYYQDPYLDKYVSLNTEYIKNITLSIGHQYSNYIELNYTKIIK